MPFYRYECTNCGYEFRHLHMEPNEDPVPCPKCESKDVQRLLPRVAVQFKGSGFYKTDRAGKRSKAGTAGHSEKSTSTDSDGTSSDSKSSADTATTSNDS